MMTVPAAVTVNPDTRRWDAVLARDRAMDGQFVYGVTSTGIFCRPSCPSRRPDRGRVRFFDSPATASEAGFRACRRCRPLDAGDRWVEKVAAACRAIADADAPVSLAVLARNAGVSRHHFLRTFTRLVGVSPREFAAARRVDAVKASLRRSDDVTTAFYEAGYGSSSRFYERAVPRLGMRPSAYRAGAEGQTIRYASAPTPLGRVLVAATTAGVCAVSLGNSERALLVSLRSEFPKAAIVKGSTELREWVDRVVSHLSGRLPQLDLPLDVRATAFQWQVWNILRAIPSGQTRTYGQVAAALGRPSAARAVARACASNPVALAVPCHRVVPSAGGSGEYRWGARRKALLLARERARA